MKKLLSFAIVALMIISSVLPVFALSEAPAAPGAANTMNLWVEDATLDVSAGNTVDVYIKLSDNTDGFTDMKIVAVYPPCLSMTKLNRGGASSIVGGPQFTAGEEKTSVDKILGDFFTEQGMNAATELGAEGTWKACGPVLSCDTTDDETDEVIDLVANGIVARYTFEYDASLNTEGLTEIPIRLYAAAMHQNKNNTIPYCGEAANVICSGGKITLENVPAPGPYTQPTIEVSDVTIKEGDATATIEVKMYENPGIWSMQSFLLYPEDASYNTMAVGEIFSEAAFTLWPETEDDGENLRDIVVSSGFGRYKKLQNVLNTNGVAYDGMKMVVVNNEHTSASKNITTEQGTLYTLTLNTASLAAGDYPISFVYTPTNTCNVKGDEVTYALVQGTLTVTGCEHPTTENINNVDPTCTEAGGYDVKCTECGQIINHVVIDALGHNMTPTAAAAASCTEPGNSAYWYCSRCEKYFSDADGNNEITLADTVVPSPGHKPGTAVRENEVPAGCTTEGSYDEVVYCTVCEAELSRENKKIDPLDHNWVEQGTTGNCGEYGTIHYKCSRCNEEKTETGALIDHDWQEVSRTEPTCTEFGHINYVCSRNAEHTKTDDVDPLGHSMTAHGANAPSCTEEGNIAYWYCSRCEKYFSDADGETEITLADTVIEKTPHTPGTAVRENEVPASCTVAGSYDEVVYCTVCNQEISRETKTILAPGHKPGTAVRENEVPAKCEESGSYDEVVYCTVCNQEISREHKTINPLDHDYVPTVTPPTCTEKGYTTYVCSRDPSHTYVSDYVDALNHDYVPVVTPPTCTEQGYTTYTCSRCQDSYVGDYVDALNHDLVAGEPVPPTCTEEGYTLYSCTRCDYSERRDIVPAPGHDYTDAEANPADPVPPTCTEEGYTPYECSRCHEIDKRDVVPALGHEWDNGTVTKEPTTEEEGVRTYHCKNCEETKTEVIPKLEKSQDEKSPKTGYTSNSTMTIIFVIATAIVAGAATVITKRKLFNK